MTATLNVTACIACILLSVALGATDENVTTVLYADTLVDVRRGRTVEDATVVVTGERIVYAGTRAASKTPIPSDARRVRLGRVTVLPGLIDAHVHLTLGGSPAANARATVESGFTTVQDLGAVGTGIFKLRDEINAGRVVGPRILAAGRWIGVKGGTCDFNGIGVGGAARFRERVLEEVQRGADLIKVCVSGWLADARRDPNHYEISDDELRAAIGEAHRQRRRVAVHAISARGITRAVEDGADLVVHAGFVDAQTTRRMRARRVYLLPTLFSFSNGPAPEDFAAVRSHLHDAVRARLPIAFGTDAGVIPHGHNAKEFAFLQELGLPAIEVLRTATTHGAAAVGMAGTIGRLEPGMAADVIAVDGNPLQDLGALQRVTFVMRSGRIIKEGS